MKLQTTIFLLVFFVLCASINFIYAGTTGKISGKITDKANMEPLISANVVVKGTSLGAATDLDGNFTIINVPPGTYTLTISIVGYRQVQFENVRVNIDLTTTVNVALESEAIEMSAVTISAERKMVIKDMTSSLSTVTAEQIQSMPVDNIGQVLRLNAGIVMSGGQITIRGGRTGEVAFWVDGIATTDVYNGMQGVTVENAAVQELQVVSGTFNAEYGQAMSGIVNIVTKDGGDKYSGQVKLYTGDYISNDPIFSVYKNLETAESPVVNSNGVKTTQVTKAEKAYPLKERNPIYSGELTLSGPIPFTSDKLRFFINSRYYTSDGYFFGSNWYKPNGAPGDRSIVPLNPLVNRSVQAKLTYWLTGNIKLKYGLFWNKYNRDRNYYPFSSNDFPTNYNSHSYLYVPYALPKNFGSSLTNMFSITQNISKSTFYEFNVSRYKNEMEQYVYKDPTQAVHYLVSVSEDLSSNPPRKAEIFDPDTPQGKIRLQQLKDEQIPYTYIVNPDGPDGYLQPNEDGGYGAPASYSFNNKGMDPTHTKRSTAYWVVKFDLTSQINKNNEVKVGGEARFHELTLDRFRIVAATDPTGAIISPFKPAVPEPNSIYRSKYHRTPKELSFYLQDKMEFNQIILNLGLRFDYFDANSYIPTDPSDPNINGPFKNEHIYKNWTPMPSNYYSSLAHYTDSLLSNKIIQEYTPDERRAFMHKKVSAKMSLSPRVGIAFPITDQGVIHFSYGHFFQIPQFQYLYSNADFKITSGTQAGAALFGNPDLRAQKTVMYEIGLQQQLAENIGVDVAMFYRDVRDWVGTSSAPIPTYKIGVSYAQFVNKDYENVRGITLKFDKRMSNNFSFRTDYTYQIAEGTYSNPTDAYNAMQNNRAPVIALVPMNWDQRHTLNAQFIYSKSDWNFSLIGTYWSGQPYTPSFPSAEATGASAVTGLTQNSANKPDQKNIDMTISRRIRLLGSYYIDIFLNVYNLLDQRDATNVYTDTGNPSYTSYIRPDKISYNSSRISTPEDNISQRAWYTGPRQVQVGLSLGF